MSSVTRVFAADYFQQFTFADLLGTAPSANQSIMFEVVTGSAIVYGATIDNTTGTMSLQIGEGVWE